MSKIIPSSEDKVGNLGGTMSLLGFIFIDDKGICVSSDVLFNEEKHRDFN